METLTIHAEPRSVIGRGLNRLRSQGVTPFVLYGKTQEPLSLQAETKALERVVQQSGLSQLIEIQTGDQKVFALVREIQRHPVRHSLLHVDAYALQMDEKQTLQIPAVTVNRLSTEISGDLIMMQNLDTITIETYPDRIPDVIEVDLSLLTMDHNILISDIAEIEGVDFLHDPDEVVISLARSAASEALDDEALPGEGLEEALEDQSEQAEEAEDAA